MYMSFIIFVIFGENLKFLKIQIFGPDFQSIASKFQHDPERSRQRMRMREERLRARESYDLEEGGRLQNKLRANTFNSKSFKYMRRQPTIVQVRIYMNELFLSAPFISRIPVISGYLDHNFLQIPLLKTHLKIPLIF